MKENRWGGELRKSDGIENYGHAPAYDGGGVEELVYGYDLFKSYYVYEHGATEKDYMDYCAKLKNCGFTLFSANSANGNLFATYFDGENIINVSFISYKDVDKYIVRDISYVLISVDSINNSALPCMGKQYEEITTIKVSLVGITALTVRLTDGRFLVIDAGLDREKIYHTLVTQNILGSKPVVAAWIFSHAHGDHMNGFFYTLEDHSEDIVIERIIHSFPGDSQYLPYKNYMEGVPNTEGEWMSRRVDKMYSYIKEKMPHCKHTIAHAGQIFEYAGVTLEVLQTSENLYKKQMFDTNMSSVIYMLTTRDGKLLLLGDAVDAAAKILRKIYGKSLKCDAVVLAHHAYNGGDEELYDCAGASVAIWPNTYESILNNGLVGNLVENHFDYRSVKYNFMMSQNEIMTLYQDMPINEVEHYTPRFDIKPTEDRVCYEKRKQPKNFLTEKQAQEGYGDAPRYYGIGEDREVFIMNPEEKSYEIKINGVTSDAFKYYCNSFKRDGYVMMKSIKDGDSNYITFADRLNEVHLSYVGDVLHTVVGPAGNNIFDNDSMMIANGKRIVFE